MTAIVTAHQIIDERVVHGRTRITYRTPDGSTFHMGCRIGLPEITTTAELFVSCIETSCPSPAADPNYSPMAAAQIDSPDRRSHWRLHNLIAFWGEGGRRVHLDAVPSDAVCDWVAAHFMDIGHNGATHLSWGVDPMSLDGWIGVRVAYQQIIGSKLVAVVRREGPLAEAAR